jgi:hypothetical protein
VPRLHQLLAAVTQLDDACRGRLEIEASPLESVGEWLEGGGVLFRHRPRVHLDDDAALLLAERAETVEQLLGQRGRVLGFALPERAVRHVEDAPAHAGVTDERLRDAGQRSVRALEQDPRRPLASRRVEVAPGPELEWVALGAGCNERVPGSAILWPGRSERGAAAHRPSP